MRHNKIYKKCFLGVNVDHLNHHITPMLRKDKPKIENIHVGVNDMMNGSDHNGLILRIDRTEFISKNYGVKNVIIFGLAYIRRIKNGVIDYVNKKL